MFCVSRPSPQMSHMRCVQWERLQPTGLHVLPSVRRRLLHHHRTQWVNTHTGKHAAQVWLDQYCNASLEVSHTASTCSFHWHRRGFKEDILLKVKLLSYSVCLGVWACACDPKANLSSFEVAQGYPSSLGWPLYADTCASMCVCVKKRRVRVREGVYWVHTRRHAK